MIQKLQQGSDQRTKERKQQKSGRVPEHRITTNISSVLEESGKGPAATHVCSMKRR